MVLNNVVWKGKALELAFYISQEHTPNIYMNLLCIDRYVAITGLVYLIYS